MPATTPTNLPTKTSKTPATVPVPGWAGEVVRAGAAAYVAGWTSEGAAALWRIDASGRLLRRAAPPGMPGNPGLAGEDIPPFFLAFAGPQTGLAIVGSHAGTNRPQRSALFATDDGARTWTRVRLPTREQPTRFAIGGGTAYALTIRCAALDTRCDQATLWSIDPTGATEPRTFASLPRKTDASGATLAAYGKSVWLLLNLGGGPGTSLASHDAGRSWRSFAVAPCQAEELKPTSADVLWQICGTGMMQGFARQTGSAPPMAVFSGATSGTSSSALLPLSDVTAFAVIDNRHGTRLEVTRDGGHSTTAVAAIPRLIARRGFRTTFVSDRVGYLVTVNGGEVYRTADGARSWHLMRAPAA